MVASSHFSHLFGEVYSFIRQAGANKIGQCEFIKIYITFRNQKLIFFGHVQLISFNAFRVGKVLREPSSARLFVGLGVLVGPERFQRS